MTRSTEITFVLNGHETTVRAEPGTTLLSILRESLDLTGTKQACGAEGECGACTVLVDGEAVRSCLLPVEKVAGRRVVTIEGLGKPGHLHPLQQAFLDYGAVQCGYCTPGMILAAAALLAREPNPSREQILEALEGNLCRCTGYVTIVAAVEAAAARLRGEAAAGLPGGGAAGSSLPRVDGVDKVTGTARYAEDIKMPGLLYAALVRSPYPHARVLAIDPTAALRLPGVLRVLTAADIPGINELASYSPGEHVFAAPGETVRMIGDSVALVIGDSPTAAQSGAAAVHVAYQPLPHTYDPEEALAPGASPIHAGGNVLSTHEVRTGDLDAVMASSDVILGTRYQTAWQEHAALERETVLSTMDHEGALTVVAGHQEPHWAQNWIAEVLGLPSERVRVVVPPMGGAFGGKQDPWPLIAGALAAYHMGPGRPVRLAYTRHESFDASPKRHPYTLDLHLGARYDGTLTGLRLRITANTGAYDSAGRYIPKYAVVAGCGPYRWQAVDAQARTVYTNGPKAGQMRGFGTPQSVFALESGLDELAVRLAIDPLELRLRNALHGHEPTALGYPPAETLGYQACLEAIRPHYQAARARAVGRNADRTCLKPGDPWRSGVGLAGMWYRFGKSGPVSCAAQAELELDGTITLFFSAPDYGQGTATIMAQLGADGLGVPPETLRLVNADTARTPDSGIQGASRSTYWVGGAVREAATRLREHILGTAAEMLDCPPNTLSLAPEAVDGPGGARVLLSDVAAEMARIGQPRRVQGLFAPDVRFIEGTRPEYLPFFISGVHLAEVDVNRETGEVRVVKVTAAHDVGRAVNPQGARGQVEGAILMGIGAALMEEVLPGATTGFSDYYLPTVRAAPEIEVILVEVPSRWGPLGAKGLGEAAALPSTPAVLNAVYHATGARVRRLPATPERVLAAMRAR